MVVTFNCAMGGGVPMLDLGLAGKVVIVAGGREGLGRACAERSAGEGVTYIARTAINFDGGMSATV